jgi:hypothetical protein
LLPTASENNSPEDEGEGIVSGIMGTLGMGTLFNQYKSVKHLFDKDNEAGEELPETSLSSNLLSSSGNTRAGEGYFELELKQTAFNESDINLN